MPDNEENKIYVVGAEWCGYSRKMYAEVAASPQVVKDRFVILEAAGKDKDHEFCKVVRGFPTLKNSKGETIQTGYAPITPELLAKFD